MYIVLNFISPCNSIIDLDILTMSNHMKIEILALEIFFHYKDNTTNRIFIFSKDVEIYS